MSTLLLRRRLLTRVPIICRRGHAGHSHSNEFLTSRNKRDPGVRITRIGLGVNVLMAVGKGVGGWALNSQALVADAWHALSDTLSDILTLTTVSWSLKPPTEKFPAGFGKIESLGSLSVSGLLLVGGLLMGYSATGSLLSEFGIDWLHLHSHAHSHVHAGPSIHAAWLAGGSIIIKEYLYRKTIAIARERDSSLLASNAVHHRVDSWTSMVALVAIGGANFFENASWLDPAGGLLVSLLVVRAGWTNTRSSLAELADSSLDEHVRDSIKKAAETKATILEVQGHKAGQTYLVEIAVAVPADYTVAQCATLEDAVRDAVSEEVRGVKRVKVRFVPADRKDSFESEFVDPHTMPDVPEEHVHKH